MDSLISVARMSLIILHINRNYLLFFISWPVFRVCRDWPPEFLMTDFLGNVIRRLSACTPVSHRQSKVFIHSEYSVIRFGNNCAFKQIKKALVIIKYSPSMDCLPERGHRCGLSSSSLLYPEHLHPMLQCYLNSLSCSLVIKYILSKLCLLHRATLYLWHKDKSFMRLSTHRLVAFNCIDNLRCCITCILIKYIQVAMLIIWDLVLYVY